MSKEWDRRERLFDERHFITEERLDSMKAYLIKNSDEPEEGEERKIWYEVGFSLNEDDFGKFSCYEYCEDKQEALASVRAIAAKVVDVLSRLIEAIDKEI